MSKLMMFFITICFFHLGEHIAQIIQVYIAGWEAHEAKGILGYWWPWLAHSETLHFAYAFIMLTGLWGLRFELSGTAYRWWMIATYVQTWHYFEHSLLLWQVIMGENLFGAPQPISVIQFLGFIRGTAESGFDGLLTMKHFGACNCEGAIPGTIHRFELLLLFVRRIEVHMLYNIAVMFPMMIAIIRRNRNG